MIKNSWRNFMADGKNRENEENGGKNGRENRRRKAVLTVILSVSMLSVLALSGCSSAKTGTKSQEKTETAEETKAAARTETAAKPQAGEEAKEPDASAETTLILANAAPVSEINHMYQYCLKFKELVEEKSDGRIGIEIHPNGELGGERDLVEGVQLGTVDMCFVASAPLGNFVPDTMAFDFPFLFRDFDHVKKVMGGGIGDDIAAQIESKAGVKFLSWGVNGFRHFCNNVKPVKSPEDMKGMKIRTMENKIHMETFSALGTDPTPMGTGELYTALQQGTVDGMEGPLTWILPSKYNEVQKYLSLTGHFYAPSAALMNQKKFDSLPEADRKLIEECAKEAESYQLQFCIDIDKKMADEAAEAGMEVIPQSELDMEAFYQSVQSVYDAHPEYKEILDKIKNVK